MEKTDLALIEQHQKSDAVLADRWKEHLTFEARLAKLENKPFLSPEEQQERNDLKKKKLAGRDEIETLLQKYRN